MHFVRETLKIGKNAKKNSKSITMHISAERLWRKLIAWAMLEQYKDDQELHRYLFLKQLSSLKYLARQGLALRGHERVHSNLIQLLKTEDIPELNKWIENRQYLSPVVINELLEMMGNSILRSILKDIQSNSGLFGLIILFGTSATRSS